MSSRREVRKLSGLVWPLLRVFLLASVAIGACVYAIVRHARPRPPMLVEPARTPSAAPSSPPDEIPAPEIVTE